MTLPKAKTRTVNGRRHYVVWHDGQEWLVPSASTLVSQLDKPAIVGWDVNRHILKAHEVAQTTARKLDPADWKAIVRSQVRADGNPEAEAGTRAHEAIEAYLLDEKLPDYEETPWAVEHAAAIQTEMSLAPLDLDGRPSVEVTVCRLEEDVPIWCGTTDLLGSWRTSDGRWVAGCVDWKTGASGVWPEAILSTSVYTGATHWVADDDGTLEPIPTSMTEGAVVWVRPEGWAWHPITEEQTTEAIEVLRSLAIVQRWRMDARIEDPVNAEPIYRERR